MGTVILNVVIILGIIIAGGFLIFFLGDLLMSIVNPKGEEERVKLKRKDSAKKFAKNVEAMPVEDQAELKAESPIAEAVIEDAKEEPVVAEATPVVEDYNADEKAEEKTEEKSEEEKLAEARAALERRKAEILKRMQEQIEQEPEQTEEESEEAEEVEEAEEAEEAEEDVEPEVEETAEETVEVDEEKEAIKAELEQAKKALEEERARYEALAMQLQNTEAEEKTVVSGTKEDYEAQKAELEARLKDNEKELKACKKEYIPLAKVNKTLANDEKKLRRKEAIVAKQKVMLYGVNNYEDIDEEKAKKLAEELDLLDGLKLSVQHCHEVMESNKDRFPVLEKMYFILKAQNEQIKADILEVENALATFETEEGEGTQE